MIVAYHAIFTTYGTWLPNDPRGSYSKEMYNEELAALRPIHYGRRTPQPEASATRRFWVAAVPTLSRPPFFIDDKTRPAVAGAFGGAVARLGLQAPACSIMNDHVHLLVLRSGYRIEYLVNQFKGAATRALDLKQMPWARGCWKVFIDDWETIRAAAHYIQANPLKAGFPSQHWDFVTPPSEV